MSECLSPADLEQYAIGTMGAEAMLRADAHVASCAACRARLLDGPELARATASLIDKVSLHRRAESACLDDEQISGYVEDTLTAPERVIVESHLDLCGYCAEDARSLRDFREQMSTHPEKVYSPEPRQSALRRWSERLPGLFSPPWIYAWAPALACLLIAVLIFVQLNGRLRSTRQELEQAHLQVEQQQLELAALRSATPEPTPEPTGEGSVVSLKDGGSVVGMRLELPPGVTLPDDLAQATGELLRTGQATPTRPVLLAMAQLASEGEPLRAGREKMAKPLSPARTFIVTTKPTFRWRPVKGATGYVVSVFSDQPRRLLWEQETTSPGSLVFPEDRPQLNPGESYAWMVEARFEGQTVQSDLAKFRVLTEPRRDEVRQLGRRYAGLHTVLAALYEREGLYEDAELELQELLRQNPGNELAQRLLRNVQKRRRTASV